MANILDLEMAMDVDAPEAPPKFKKSAHKAWSERNMINALAAKLRGDRKVFLAGIGELTTAQMNAVRDRLDVMHMAAEDGSRPWSEHVPLVLPQPASRPEYLQERGWPDDKTFKGGYTLRFLKRLGVGGSGTVSLWELIRDGSTRPQRVVLKCPTRAKASVRELDGEMEFLCCYDGATHTLQKLNLDMTAQECRRWLKSKRRSLPRHMSMFRKFPEKDGALILEFAEHGDMFDVMGQAFRKKRHYPFKPQQLWEIWECLVKGVGAIAYKPDQMTQDIDEDMRNLARVRGILPRLKDSHHVHFDIEEQNILVSGAVPEHPNQPTFKLHDFGHPLSVDMREVWEKMAPESTYRRMRHPPKHNRRTPEQIHGSWDDIMFEPDKTRRPRQRQMFAGDKFDGAHYPVAGRYGTWTNIFLIGQIMEGVLLGKWLIHPFTCRNWPLRNYHGKFFPTYGHRLEPLVTDEYRSGPYTAPVSAILRPEDKELVHMVAQCMAEMPQDRPTLPQLLEKLIKAKPAVTLQQQEESRILWEDLLAKTPRR